LEYCLKCLWVHPYTIPPAKMAPDLVIWVAYGLEMMPLHHGSG
jgi:hypothetical protein